jgi:hypothetical protein
MKTAATALPIVLALTATAFARAAHHPAATGTSTIDSGYSAPRTWNETEVSTPSAGHRDDGWWARAFRLRAPLFGGLQARRSLRSKRRWVGLLAMTAGYSTMTFT